MAGFNCIYDIIKVLLAIYIKCSGDACTLKYNKILLATSSYHKAKIECNDRYDKDKLKSIILQEFPIILSGNSFFSDLLFPKLCSQFL